MTDHPEEPQPGVWAETPPAPPPPPKYDPDPDLIDYFKKSRDPGEQEHR